MTVSNHSVHMIHYVKCHALWFCGFLFKYFCSILLLIVLFMSNFFHLKKHTLFVTLISAETHRRTNIYYARKFSRKKLWSHHMKYFICVLYTLLAYTPHASSARIDVTHIKHSIVQLSIYVHQLYVGWKIKTLARNSPESILHLTACHREQKKSIIVFISHTYVYHIWIFLLNELLLIHR